MPNCRPSFQAVEHDIDLHVKLGSMLQKSAVEGHEMPVVEFYACHSWPASSCLSLQDAVALRLSCLTEQWMSLVKVSRCPFTSHDVNCQYEAPNIGLALLSWQNKDEAKTLEVAAAQVVMSSCSFDAWRCICRVVSYGQQKPKCP